MPVFYLAILNHNSIASMHIIFIANIPSGFFTWWCQYVFAIHSLVTEFKSILKYKN